MAYVDLEKAFDHIDTTLLYHNLPTFMAYVDIEKAFNHIDTTLLYHKLPTFVAYVNVEKAFDHIDTTLLYHKLPTFVAYVYLEKAFDHIDTTLLYHKLRSLGFGSKMYDSIGVDLFVKDTMYNKFNITVIDNNLDGSLGVKLLIKIQNKISYFSHVI